MNRQTGHYLLLINAFIILFSIAGCGSDSDKCYYCETNQPGSANVSNVCGDMMRDYYEGLNYTCFRE